MKNLEDKLKVHGNAARMMREVQTGRYAFPILSEFTNWIDEMRAWRETAALMDQSFHMTGLYLKGPDILRHLSDLGVNSFANFGRYKAKQLVCVNHDGFVIGDAVVFGLEDDEINIVGRPTLPNWFQFHAETGGYDVIVTWGEPDGGSSKPAVERHRQMQVRATVHPWPIYEASRLNYRKQI